MPYTVTTIAEAETAINALDTRLSAIESAVSTLQGQMSTLLGTTVPALQSADTTHTSGISAHGTRLDALEAAKPIQMGKLVQLKRQGRI